jgi:MFS transporter, SP family, general alpha glucoside:H+ symporter
VASAPAPRGSIHTGLTALLLQHSGCGPYLSSFSSHLLRKVRPSCLEPLNSASGLTISCPWWLVRKGSLVQARRSLRKLVTQKFDVEPQLAMIIKTDRLESEKEAITSYRDILTKVNLRRTEICAGVYTVQVLSGIMASTSFSVSPHSIIPSNQTFYVLTYKAKKSNVIWTQASILIIWNFFYSLTIGPVGFSILCETSASHVREKTIAFSTAVQAFIGIGMMVAVPYMINPDEADLAGKIGFFLAGWQRCRSPAPI